MAHAPPPLPERPVIRVVHPCGALGAHRGPLEAGLARLEGAGCEVRWDSKRAEVSWRGYLAGTDTARRDELIAALAEPGVDAVWFARGGSGGARIADAVVRAARHLAPRIVVGFSDATVFLNLLASRLGWITFHGPVITSLRHPAIDVELDRILAVLSGQRLAVPFADPADAGELAVDDADRRSAIPPIAGTLMGGNLTVLAASMGTPAAPAAVEDAVWLLEDVGEPPYRLDRSFWQIGSLLRGARALWLGDLGLPDDTVPVGERFGEDSGLPVVDGAPAGHRGPIDILPIGAPVVLDPVARCLRGARWVEASG